MTLVHLVQLALVLALTVSLPAAVWLILHNRRSSRLCPHCDVELATISAPGMGPNRTYEVAACLRCTQTAIFVDARRTEVARCPVCREDELAVATVRVTGMPPRVGVRESCAHCGHEKTFTVSVQDEGPAGKVIAFPGPGDRPRRREQHGGEG